MDTRPNPPIPRPLPEEKKRPQKYLHFTLQPGDEKLVAQLPAAQQAVLRAEGSYEIGARELGIPIGTFRSRLHRARDAIVKMREAQVSQNVKRAAVDPDAFH
jgi:DNA-directed RNA polymerase specialized sigma24 family protein